ncbi:hypothetical protein COL5a_002509 [Colletotrichum fioriniae]|nr:hypothetical protein COL5a_002509 [Colletotrichum fioriniae]
MDWVNDQLGVLYCIALACLFNEINHHVRSKDLGFSPGYDNNGLGIIDDNRRTYDHGTGLQTAELDDLGGLKSSHGEERVSLSSY